MEGRGGKGSPGGRPPPKRTYGSRQGSGRLHGPNFPQNQAEGGKSARLSGASSTTYLYRSATPPALLHPEPADVRLKVGEGDGASAGAGAGLLSQQSAIKFGRATCVGIRSTEEISRLIGAAGEGGETGRTSAIALAQACKSRQTRRAIRANAGGILSELTRTLLVSLRVGEGHRRERDEATVHGLAVAMFVCSKDRTLVKSFSGSAVSALAVLIEGDRRWDVAPKMSLGARTAAAGGAASLAATAVDRRNKSALLGGTLRPIDEKHASGSRSSAYDEGPSPFKTKDEDREEEGLHGGFGDDFGAGRASGGSRWMGNNQRLFAPHGSAHEATSRGGRQQAPVNDHGSANAMVRARMLLDIADMVPWGMANRHLVSSADLGLATLLNVAAQACSEGGEPVDEDVGTQSSMGSQSEPSSVVEATANGHADGAEATTVSNNAGVMAELSRRAPSGFLLPLVVGGATALSDLWTNSSSRRQEDGGRRRGGGVVLGDATADPSPLRAVHQLLLALRLLDLATLESSGEVDGTAAKPTKGADPGGPPHSHHYAELTGALLLVVARCQPLCGDSASSDAAGREKGKTPAGKFGQGRRQQHSAPSPSPQPALGGEVAGKVHQCLLAALRVLINVTHHDGRICAEVAARRGLETLMSCLVARSSCRSQGNDTGDVRGLAPAHERSDLELLGDVVNGAPEDFPGTGSEDGKGGFEEADAIRGDFDAQVLAMSALINCVELKESAQNCVDMATLKANPPAAARADGERTGGDRQRQESRSAAGDVSSSRCLAPEFLAKLLIRSTRSFAHQFEAGRLGEEDEDGPASPAPSGALEHRGGGEGTGRRSKEGADPSAALAASPAAEPMASAASATPQGADSGEQLMSHAEGTDLVLGGHCALLLGLLVRGHESNRRLALPVLPGGDPTLIVRVLEAFMALQFQAGVLTEEIVLAVQGLVEELEGMEAVPVKEWNPFEIDTADEEGEEDILVASPPAAARNIDALTIASPKGGRKRPRTAATTTSTCGKMPTGVQRTFVTPSSGQWAGEGGEGNDSADDFSLSVKRPKTASQGEDSSSLWLTQSPSSEETPPAELPEPSPSSSSAPTKAPSEERLPTATTPSKDIRGGEAGETPQSCGRTPGGSTRVASSWRVAGSSIAGRIGVGIRGRSTSATRSWLGSSPQLRTYRNRSFYGNQALQKSSSSRPRADLYSSSSNHRVGKEAPTGREGRPSSAVFEILSEDSDESTEGLGGERGGGGGGGGRSVQGGHGGATVSIGGGGIGPRGGRSGSLAATATSSTFGLDDWSDSSNDNPVQQKSREAVKPKAQSTRVAMCQLHSLSSPQGKCSGGGTGGDGFGSDGSDDGAPAQWTKPGRVRSRSPSPKAPPVAARGAGGKGPRPFQGVGPRSGGSGRESSRTVAPARAPCAGVKVPVRERAGQASGEVISQPLPGRSSNSSASEWRVGAGSHLGRLEGKSVGVLRAATALRPSARGDGGGSRGRLGGTKEPLVQGELGAEGGVGKARGVLEKPASRNVFEMSDEDESD